MELRIYTKESDLEEENLNQPVISPCKVHTIPCDAPKFDYLKKCNYLGEFFTEVDKARVRNNLGIPDSYNFNWGNIKGTISSLSDLILKFNEVRLECDTECSNLQNQINDIISNLETISDKLLEIYEYKDTIIANSLAIEELQVSLADVYAKVLLSLNTSLLNASNILDLQERVSALESRFPPN